MGTSGHGRRVDADSAGAEPVDLPQLQGTHRGSRGRLGHLAERALHVRVPDRELHGTGADGGRGIRKHPPSPPLFLTAPGHDAVSARAGAAVVVERKERYVLLEMIGVAAEVA